MTARSYAADDAETISTRMKELDAQRAAISACTCEPLIGTKGEVIRIPPPGGCPVHGVGLDDGGYG